VLNSIFWVLRPDTPRAICRKPMAPADPRIGLGVKESAPLADPRPRALPRLLGLDLTIARRGVGLQRGQQATRAVGHFGNRAVERLGLGRRAAAETARS